MVHAEPPPLRPPTRDCDPVQPYRDLRWMSRDPGLPQARGVRTDCWRRTPAEHGGRACSANGSRTSAAATNRRCRAAARRHPRTTTRGHDPGGRRVGDGDAGRASRGGWTARPQPAPRPRPGAALRLGDVHLPPVRRPRRGEGAADEQPPRDRAHGPCRRGAAAGGHLVVPYTCTQLEALLAS